MKNVIRVATIVMLFFLAALATGGGIMLILDPSGLSMQFPPELLLDTPFADYRVPGILLLLSNGILPIIIGIMVILRTEKYQAFIIFQGIVLFLWLTIELILNIDYFYAILHFPLYTMSLWMIGVGLRLQATEP